MSPIEQAIQEIGPPPSEVGPWFPMALWECPAGHQIVGALNVGSGVHSNCDFCSLPLSKVRGAWVRGG